MQLLYATMLMYDDGFHEHYHTIACRHGKWRFITGGLWDILGDETMEEITKTIPLQDGVLYGPIHSRRLGESLGINLLPVSYKLCSFNCVYCQYGWTTNKNEEGEKSLSAAEWLAVARPEVERLKQKGLRVDCMTFAGNGEPTLHPELGAIVRGFVRLRDEYYPKATLGILSDSHCVYKPEVREALALLDHRYMKLDVGTPEMLEKVNKPMMKTDWEAMVEGLRLLKDTILQSLFVAGSLDSTAPEMIEAWIATVRRIAPMEVQVYTVSRGTADPGIRKVSQEKLKEIATLLTQRTGIPASVFD